MGSEGQDCSIQGHRSSWIIIWHIWTIEKRIYAWTLHFSAEGPILCMRNLAQLFFGPRTQRPNDPTTRLHLVIWIWKYNLNKRLQRHCHRFVGMQNARPWALPQISLNGEATGGWSSLNKDPRRIVSRGRNEVLSSRILDLPPLRVHHRYH